jgi:hypothetical protein
MKQMTLVDDLKAAKALIDTPEKWAKGAWLHDDGTRCAEGACIATTGGRTWSPLFDNLIAQLPPEWIATGNPIVRFNDDDATTRADVLALFDRAIAAAEASAS